MTRGYLWRNLQKDIVEEFAALTPSVVLPSSSQIVDEHKRVKIGEMHAARKRIGEEWWDKLIADARMRGTEASPRTKTRKVKQKGRPRGGAISTPRLEEQRAKERERQDRKQNRRRAMRERLPDERVGRTHHFTLITKTQDGNGTREIDGYIQTGTYADGKLGEVFLKVDTGDEFVMLDMWAISASVALQFGAPVDDLFKKFVGQRFEPSGATTNKEIPRCTSLVDYAARWILRHYGSKA
jgi:hypothetical protein